jgi:CelD/BcsL family acetyltransferase involved in cellulose biosynthesis
MVVSRFVHTARMMMGPAYSQSAIHYEVLTEVSQIAALSAEWDALLDRSKCNRAFSCSKWYLATPDLLPQLQPLVLVARRNHGLAGILPLWLNVNRREAGFPDDYSDHLDIIAEDGDIEVATGLMDLALSDAGNYDTLVLKHIKQDANCVSGIQNLKIVAANPQELFAAHSCLEYAVVNLARGYAAYRKTLNKHFRKALVRESNQSQRKGILVRELSSGDLDPQRLPETFLSLHFSRFGDRSTIRTDFQNATPWITKLFPCLFAERRMRVFAILNQQEFVGIHLAMVGRDGMYGWNSGFIPEILDISPGNLLFDFVIRQSCEEGLHEYDFGWWGQDYKRHWKPFSRTIGEIRLSLRSCSGEQRFVAQMSNEGQPVAPLTLDQARGS